MNSHNATQTVVRRDIKMMNFKQYPKQEGNTCRECAGTGIIQWFDCDGMTIYHWQKPKTKQCDCQKTN